MTFPLPLEASTLEALTWTFVHFLWQGIFLTAVAACLLHVARLRTAQARYAAYCGLLVLLAACPLATFYVVSARQALTTGDMSRNEFQVATPAAAQRMGVRVDRSPRTSFVGDIAAAALADWLSRRRSWVVDGWLAGVTLFGCRLVSAAIGVWLLKRKCLPLPRHLVLVVERLARQMPFRVTPRVFAVENLLQAAAIGIFKPVIVLPAAWLCELPPDVLEAVLAHELAHIRRWDLPINLLQRLVEALFFFHPAVWWCSRRIRIEREMCCDSVALAAVGSRADYARALTYLADQRLSPSRMVLAAGIGGTRMVLLERIRNVLGTGAAARGRFYGPSCAAAGAALATIAWLVVLGGFHGDTAGQPPRSVALRNPVVPPEAVNRFPLGFSPGEKVQPRAGLISQVVPNERAKWRLPNYTIEPPDILRIEVAHFAPKATYRIQPSDVLAISLAGTIQGKVEELKRGDAGEKTRSYTVDREGFIDLELSLSDGRTTVLHGPGSVEVSFKQLRFRIHVGELTQEETREAIRAKLQAVAKDAQVSLHLEQSSALPPIAGEHLVAPDGSVNLRAYGQVIVSGMTLEEAKAVIEEKLAAVLEEPRITVQVFAYNSKVYYVIVEGGDSGDTVARLPITGAETVLDALSQLNGVGQLSSKKIWIARPAPDIGGADAILPVNWIEITQAADASSNYQVLPGDRIFIRNRADGIYNELRNYFFFFFRAASTGSLARGSFNTLPVSAAL